MRRFSVLAALLLMAGAGLRSAAQAPSKGGTVTGVFLGRSGKPMKNARLALGQVVSDQLHIYAKVRIISGAAATADDAGKFELKDFAPGKYTLVYVPAGAAALWPVEVRISSLLAQTPSKMPMMKNVELGGDKPNPDQNWPGQFTLLRGHTFLSEGAYMKIWNATARKGASGPYFEVRKGILWTAEISPGSQIKFDAWSY